MFQSQHDSHSYSLSQAQADSRGGCREAGKLTVNAVHGTYLKGLTRLRQVLSNFLGLQERCIHPETQKPYIRQVSGGRDNSPEGLQVCPLEK